MFVDFAFIFCGIITAPFFNLKLSTIAAAIIHSN